MEPLKLPPSLSSVEIPMHLGVTRLAVGAPCLLHAVAARDNLPRRPGGPFAELGKLVHTLNDLAITGRLGINGVPDNVADAFEQLLSQAKATLSLTPETSRYADLSVAFTKREWEKRRFYAISGAESVRKPPRSESGSFVRADVEPISLRRLIEQRKNGAEVPFESSALRIRGRLDFVSVTDDEITVSDFKSGRVASADGTVNEQTSRQMRLYALAIAEVAPMAKISLRIVSQGIEWVESFDDRTRAETTDWLRGIADGLQAGSSVAAEELAVMGPQCKRCDIRPMCPVYRRTIGELWKRADNEFELPLDIAGAALGCDRQADGYFSLKLQDLAGRIVKVHRLSDGVAPTEIAGSVLWLFDLASIEAKMQATGWRHPRNFHEIAMLPTERTAWTVQVFEARN